MIKRHHLVFQQAIERFSSALQKWLYVILLVTSSFVVAPAQAQETRTVQHSQELLEALQTAIAGQVFELAPGTYAPLQLKGLNGTAGAPVVLRSADPKNPARLLGLDLRESNYVTFDGLVFDYQFGGFDAANIRPFQVFTSRFVTFENSLFDGDLASGLDDSDGFPTGFGLAVSASTQVTLKNNEIRDFYRGMVIFDVVDIKVQDNLLHAIRMDGMNFAQVENVLIENNTIRDFKRVVESSDHADMIQFWTNRTERPSRNIIIRNNVLNSGLGAYTQSIFMRNDLVDRNLAGYEMYYRDVIIEENVIINAHLHGITLGESDGVRIANNTLIHNPASDGKQDNPPLWIPQIRVKENSKNVDISNNMMSKVVGHSDQITWRVSGNVTIQDRAPSQPGYYDKVFVAARTGDPRNLASFQYLNPGSAGASRLAQQDDAGLLFVPLIHNASVGSDTSAIVFSAKRSLLPKGVSLKDTKISWQINGNPVSSDVEIAYEDTTPGLHTIALEITLPDGQSRSSETTLHVKGDLILEYSLESGELISFGANDPVALNGLPLGRAGLAFGDRISAWEIPSDHMGAFFEAPAFVLKMRLRLPTSRDNTGELLRIHQSLTAELNGRGALSILFNTQDTRLNMVTTPLFRQAGDIVDVVFDYDSERGSLDIYANEALIASGQASGLTEPRNAWGLGFGAHLNNRKGAYGEIQMLSLSVPQKSAFELQ